MLALILFLTLLSMSTALYDNTQANIGVWLSGATYCNRENYISMILAGPATGFNITHILYDIKCTCRDKSIYEILQLLGYASLLNCVPKFNKKINNISIINLLQGYIVNYDISYITTEQMVNYLRILTK